MNIIDLDLGRRRRGGGRYWADAQILEMCKIVYRLGWRAGAAHADARTPVIPECPDCGEKRPHVAWTGAESGEDFWACSVCGFAWVTP